MKQTKPILAVAFLLFATSAFTPVSQAQQKADRDEATVPKDDQGSEKEAEEKEVVPMTIGSPAPQLDIEHWIQDGDGHFAKVTEFEQDKVYIVEFWATWCGPCISAMPHIAELQKKYADRGVQVVSITREDVDTVNAFLDRKVRGTENDDEPQTYRQLTSGYCLTSDPDMSSDRDYMKAANRNGIPCAFIVGKDAKIEWIGHPMSIDEPLEKVVTDDWDREAYLVEYVAEQEAREVLSKVSMMMRAKKTQQAIAILDDYIATGKSETQKSRFRQIKFQVLVGEIQVAENNAAQFALELLDDDTLDASGVNNIAWTIYQLAEANRLKSDEVLQSALDVAQKAVKDAGPQKAFLMDTVAHLQHKLGDSKAALETQRAAMEAADPDDKQRLAEFLQQLEEEAKADADESQDDDN